jgi:hypothetical protein
LSTISVVAMPVTVPEHVGTRAYEWG